MDAGIVSVRFELEYEVSFQVQYFATDYSYSVQGFPLRMIRDKYHTFDGLFRET